MPQPNIPPSAQFSTSSLPEITAFTLMVAAIATVAFAVMGEFDWLTACFLGGGIGLLAGTVLAVLLRSPRSAPADKPVGRAPRASAGREGAVVPETGGDGAPATTLQSRGTGGIPDAGGVGLPATPAARSPLDPAEIPVAGAGGPPAATSVADAKVASPAPAEAKVAATAPGESKVASPVLTESGDGSGDGSDGAVAYDPSTAPAEPIVKPATAKGAPETVESEREGPEPVKPTLLDAPREGGPDDLTRIRGVGPALESMLHDMGVYHFEQIAAWGPGEVAWADENLEDFKGRVTRDDWVGQAEAIRAEDAAKG